MDWLMKGRRIWWLVAGVAAIAAVGVGVSLRTIALLGFLLLCPLAMAGMHGGGHAHGGSNERASDGPAEDDREAGSASGSLPAHHP